ncbi:MAG: hypothetical protein IPL36_13180 [Nigerium sp.]|nr:hypothetical protein [Nigerium sp.]
MISSRRNSIRDAPTTAATDDKAVSAPDPAHDRRRLLDREDERDTAQPRRHTEPNETSDPLAPPHPTPVNWPGRRRSGKACSVGGDGLQGEFWRVLRDHDTSK